MRKRARDFLFTAPPGAVAAYLNAARPFLDTDPAFLTTLFKPYSAKAAQLMDRMLAANTLEPGDWMKLCGGEIDLTKDEWGEFVLENNRLANLLVGLGGDGVGAVVWQGYLESLTPALVSPELIEVGEAEEVEPEAIHVWERTVHAHLRDAAERLPKSGAKLVQALPEGGVARLFAANNLLKWVDHPELAEKDGSEEVQNACATFGVDRSALVKVAYKKGGFDQITLPDQAEQLVPIVELFKACFPVDSNFNTARHAVTEVIKLSADCPKETRGVFQAHFVSACVPDIHFTSLLNEQRQYRFEPLAEALIRQRLAKPTKKSGSPYVPPSRTEAAAEAVPVEDGGFADEVAAESEVEEVITTKKASSKGKKTHASKKAAKSTHGKKDNSMSIRIGLLVGFGILSIVLLVFAISRLGGDKESPSPQQETPKTEPKQETKPEPKSGKPEQKKGKDK